MKLQIKPKPKVKLPVKPKKKIVIKPKAKPESLVQATEPEKKSTPDDLVAEELSKMAPEDLTKLSKDPEPTPSDFVDKFLAKNLPSTKKKPIVIKPKVE